MVAFFEIDFAKLFISVIHERFFKDYLLPICCIVFQSCRNDRVPIWHIEVLCTPRGSVNIGLIKDVADEVEPRRGPKVEM